MKNIVFFFVVLLHTTLLFSQQEKILSATRISEAPSIDGVLDDAIWNSLPYYGDFYMLEPGTQGEIPKEYQTKVQLAYDDTAVYIAGENTGFVTLTIADLHNQPMPAGTKITFSPSVGGGATPSTFVWPNDNHNGGLTFSVGIKGAKEPTAGVLSVTIETEEGKVATTFSPVTIIIQ